MTKNSKDTREHRFPDGWMGDVRLMLIWGAGAFVLALALLCIARSTSSGPDLAIFFRIADVTALLFGAAGVFVVVVDATRNVAEWRYAMIRDWDIGPRETLRRAVETVLKVTETEPDHVVAPDHPDRATVELFYREAPVVHQWAQRAAARVNELGAARDVEQSSHDRNAGGFALEGELEPPRPTQSTLAADVAMVVGTANYYVEVRELQEKWRQRASGDTDARRAVFALAPYFLTVGIGIGLAAIITRPLS